MFLTLYSNEKDQIIEHPDIEMMGRSGSKWVVADDNNMMPLPKGASLVSLPNQIPIGLAGDKVKWLDYDPINRRSKVNAVAALLPQGFTRTLLPASVRIKPDELLPLYGYAAVGFKNDQIYVAAIKTDEHRKWHPRYYNTSQLPAKISRLVRKYPDNRILKQLVHCSVEYGCYTAQNMFFQRWEAGIPTTNICNANCIGCISKSHQPCINSPQNRLTIKPDLKEIIELGQEHLNTARDGIISFGQGCEGEPSLNANTLAQAIKQIRYSTLEGTINMNTNAGYTEGILKMCEAGLDSLRVSVFSFGSDNYNKYHRPQGYGLKEVLNSITHAKDSGTKVSINLLTFPGFTDREEEIECLFKFLEHSKIDMIQFRNLNIDPDYLMKQLDDNRDGVGIDNLLLLLSQEFPEIKIGSYTHSVK